MRKIRTNVINPLTPDEAQVLADHILILDEGLIIDLRAFDPALDTEYEDRRDQLALPGFIDLHVHLSQYRMRGHYQPALLPWLQNQVFPVEAKSRDRDYARLLAGEFFSALFAVGTTTAVIYTAPFRQACETAFEAARACGARCFIGMTLMDRNSPENLIQSTEYALQNSIELFRHYNASTPLLNYIFTPRFAPSCSEELMREIAAFAAGNGAFIQTHLSENRDELDWVHRLFGRDSYTQVYAAMGLLTPRTILAHCIHLSDPELDILKDHDCRIAHCPDSNFYLKSGEFDYPRLSAKGLQIGIGSDVGAGTSLNMLYHAKMANFRQSAYPLLPERLLYHITLGNARILGLEDRIGSLQPGKEADLCFLGVPAFGLDEDNILSELCFAGHEFPVRETLVARRSVYQS